MRVNEDTLTQVGADVLETVAFAIVVPGTAEKAPGEALVKATVRFSGPFKGAFSLTIPQSAAPGLANNMLGRDEMAPATAREAQDAIGELANIICGNVLSAVAGPAPVFDLSAPEHAGEDPAQDDPAPAGEATSVTLPLMTGYAALSVTLTGEA